VNCPCAHEYSSRRARLHCLRKIAGDTGASILRVGIGVIPLHRLKIFGISFSFSSQSANSPPGSSPLIEGNLRPFTFLLWCLFLHRQLNSQSVPGFYLAGLWFPPFRSLAISVSSPLGVIAMTWASFIATTEVSFADFAGLLMLEATSSRMESTGRPMRLASSLARDSGYTNSWP
jgi:hypothetical protein